MFLFFDFFPGLSTSTPRPLSRAIHAVRRSVFRRVASVVNRLRLPVCATDG